MVWMPTESSLVQRRLHIGSARAARITEALEERRIAGPDQGADRGRDRGHRGYLVRIWFVPVPGGRFVATRPRLAGQGDLNG